MTLAALIRLADEAGRQARPDKSGRIAAESPSALDAFRTRALGAEERIPDGSIASDGRLDPHSPSWLGELAADVRATVKAAMATLKRHGELLASIVEAEARSAATVAHAAAAETDPSDCAPDSARQRDVHTEPAAPRIRWFGSAAGADGSRGAEARRRSARRVVDVRPTAA